MAESPDALIARAAEHYRSGDYAAAARCGLAILAQAPNHFDALHLLGVLCSRRKHWADAGNYLTRAARIRPHDPKVNHNRGIALSALKLHPAAIDAFQRCLAVEPSNADALNDLGTALRDSGREKQAVEVYRALLAIRPDHAPAHFNLGSSLVALGDRDGAITSFQAAMAYAPATTPEERLVDIVCAMGHALIENNRVEDALAVCQDLRRRLPDQPKLDWNASLALLHLGDYAAGWRDYESRWLVAEHDKCPDGASLPSVDDLTGQRVLLVGEQGRGDIIQFVRYAPLLAARGAVVSLRVYDDLTRLFAAMPSIDAVVGEDQNPPPHDRLTPLLSLPLVFGTTPDTIPASNGYLRPPADLASDWRTLLGPRTQPRIGLCWRGMQHIPKRSMPLSALRPLLNRENVSFHAVQKDVTPSDRDDLLRDGRIRDHSADLTDFADTAALIAALDLVITIDTAVAHLAGALGKPVWIMLPYSADWRWLRNRDDSPWYKTARLFRQSSPGEWRGVIALIAQALATWLSDLDATRTL